MGNSTWNSLSYQANFTLSPPLLPKSKAAACEQLHIAIEVWRASPFVPGDYSSNVDDSLPLSSSGLVPGLSDPGNHLPAGEHPGHHGHREEQEPALTHVLLCLQVGVSLILKSS